ncbi:Serine carboxypeptidase-like 35 [Hibiscus syriacus]|uniref:Serine carboxypeptidase-like 35 n=1 Tax=Hibiscus syriacus TaxID=106335 RepID=A0A6A2YFY9_HIBSY|nr:Serine carboxypeptidase-like 35 [Hibiscus syriacus]
MAVRVLAKRPTFAKYRRKLQFEDDINLLFMYTSYNRLGKDAKEADAEDIIDMVSKASFADQLMQVQENVHDQNKNFCAAMDGIILPGSAVPETRPVKRAELSEVEGLYLNGEANVGAVIALYPGVIYSPAYHQYVPGYTTRLGAQNRYLITRFDRTVIDAQPWDMGVRCDGEVLERRNPLAVAHFANNPTKETVPKVMVFPYDFPLAEKDMRAYIPNISFGNAEEAKLRKSDSSWFTWSSRNSPSDDSNVPVLKILVLVATTALLDEEVLLQSLP